MNLSKKWFRRVCVSSLLISIGIAAWAEPPAPRSPVESEHLARDVLAELVGLDTTHAVGSAKAVEALAKRFRDAGFSASDIYVGGPRPDKMNIVVRFRGRGKGAPVLFNAHLDVVEATRDTWSVEPFRLTEKDGFFYGRGTIDVKQEVAIVTANLIRLKQEHFVPDRDVIAFFNTDEEAGGDANGVEWMIKEHRPLIDAGLVINQDAGKGQALRGVRLWSAVQTAEKVYATYELSATGSGGHSSLPPRDNAIAKVSAAVARLDGYQFPVRFSATTRRYLEATASHLDAAQATALRKLLANPDDGAALDAIRDVPVLNAQVHSTCPATLVQGGQSESALPMKAKATLQCRLLPDEEPAAVLATLRRVVADPAVEITVSSPPAQSPPGVLDPGVMKKIEKVTTGMWPGVGVVPVMSSGASDNVFFRLGGFQTLGVSGTFVEETDLRAHGRDERVAVTAFYESLEFSYRLIQSLSSAR
jgi:acetylornithine deacetylase/succinyl-diaminopimelate desuccinylase-like protein